MTALRPILLLLLCVLSCRAAATITRGSTDEVIVRTWPEGASVYLSNGMTGISPVTFEPSRATNPWWSTSNSTATNPSKLP
ncbi:MAG: hypothetical protein R3F17_02715 [Planctomycetota bacterium]